MANIPDVMVEVGTRLQAQYGDKPIPDDVIRREAVKIGGWSLSSIMPYDFCYNHENMGSRPAKYRVFCLVSPGMYKYVGRDYAGSCL
jgi:hypothetical protein